jgi:hypothetical protein
MRKFLTICAILLSLSASAQWQLTGSRVRYVNGIGIPTRDTSAMTPADSSQILIRPADSSLYVRYKRAWQKVGAGGGGISGSGTINRVPKWTSSTALGNSSIVDSASAVAMTINQAGIIGVNTTSPGGGYNLTLNGNSTTLTGGIEFRQSGTATFFIGNPAVTNTTDFELWNPRNGYLRFGTNNAERMRITSGGNVGIDYTAPAARLAVNGTALINTNTDNGVDRLQVSGSALASTLKVNTSGQTTTISNYYAGGTGRNIWIGGGGTSSNSSAWGNVSLGDNALLSTTSGFFNTAIGASALQLHTTGDRNMAIGFEALYATTSGTRNVGIGVNALGTNSTGSNNMAIGTAALLLSTAGDNCAIGSDALREITTGANNVAIGTDAGRRISGGGNNQTSGTSIYIGQDTRSSANGNTNEIVIGHNAIGQGSNTVTLGNSSITKKFLRGNTMVNTTTDNGVDELQVNGSIQGTGFNQAYTARTTTYTAANTDYFIDCTSGSFTVNLFTAVGNTGRILIIKNSGTGTITVDPNGSQTIDGATTQSLATQWSRVHIISDGANWKIISN